MVWHFQIVTSTHIHIPTLDSDDWNDIWDFPVSSLVSIRDLYSLKLCTEHSILHRLHKMNPVLSPECRRCSTLPGDFLHIFWHCLRLQYYWSEVRDLINLVASVTILMTMEVCLLGLIETIIPTVAKKDNDWVAIILCPEKHC